MGQLRRPFRHLEVAFFIENCIYFLPGQCLLVYLFCVLAFPFRVLIVFVKLYIYIFFFFKKIKRSPSSLVEEEHLIARPTGIIYIARHALFTEPVTIG